MSMSGIPRIVAKKLEVVQSVFKTTHKNGKIPYGGNRKIAQKMGSTVIELNMKL